MDKKRINKYKRLLLEKRNLVLSEIEHLQKGALKKSQRDSSGDLSGYVYHMADVGTDNFDREFSLDLVSNEREILYEIDEALKRIKEGGFGKCERCGNEINAGRLEAVPYARLCLHCKEQEETKTKIR